MHGCPYFTFEETELQRGNDYPMPYLDFSSILLVQRLYLSATEFQGIALEGIQKRIKQCPALKKLVVRVRLRCEKMF